ncbi:MAG: DUF1919 domain-containing protein [Tenericutes bacterium]|nr:DUF1919 domain-containing protein [Mycoplasmatota bacterium]
MKKWIGKIKRKFENSIFEFCRKLRLKNKIKKLKNKDITILSSDCLGGVIYHDFNLRFLSPTINLYIKPHDFIKFCRNLDFYIDKEIVEIKEKDHIIGKLEDIELHFLHYKSFKEASDKWHKRAKRINRKNIFVILTYKDGCTKQNINDFNELDYDNKIIFVPQKYNNYDCSYYIKGSENEKNEIEFLGNRVNIFGKKLIDSFDIVSFLNKEDINNEK